MIYKFTLLLGLLLFTGLNPLFADDPPVMSGNETSSPQYFTETNNPVALFPDFTITDADGDDIKGLVIAFTSGNHTDQDILSFTDQNGITGSFDKTKGALVLSGAASPADYQTAVRSITYSNDAAPGAVSYDQRELTISFANSDYLASTGHFYEFINSASSWDAAKTAASAKTYYGLQGYLATVTSAEENSFVKSKLSSYNTWLGGSDAATEGSWLWATGPEKDTQFSTGATAYNSSYVNWKSGEPNNTNGTEDCLIMYYSDGSWNDGGNNTPIRYIVEYGGMSGETLKMTTTTTLNVVAPQPPVINGHNDSPTYNTSEYNPVHVFPNFTVTDAEDSDIKGLTIYFSSGYQSNQDTLLFTNTSKIEGYFDDTQGALVLLGDASPAEYQAAMRSITYVNNAPLFSLIDGNQREFTISLANADYFSQDLKLDNGHFYEYVNAADTWAKAKAAASTTYYGLQGYLATVTSENEQDFILSISDKTTHTSLWLGGSDEATPNTWKWVTGPEDGTIFYKNGAAVSGNYENWYTGQPDNYGGNETCLQFFTNQSGYTAGTWNDRQNVYTTGYIVEYGGMDGDPTINMTTTTTLNINVVRPEAPGGIVDNLRVWFNANSGTKDGGSSITNGTITSWEGQKPYGVNITTVNNVAGDPSVVPNSANYNSVVSFDGDDAIRTDPTAPYTTYFNSTEDKNTAFLVKKTTAGKVEAGYSSATSSKGRAGYFERASGYQRTDYGKEPTIVHGNTTTINKYIIARQDVQPSGLSLYLDGTLETTSTFNSLAGSNDGYLAFGANPQDFSSPSTTDIAEYIIYAADLSDTEVKEVESYLALKYGISKTDDYLASDDSTIWSATDNTGYTTDIFGIGQDNASGLNQKVSRSVNNANGPILATIQNFTASNTDGSRTELGNGNFMLMGHNNGTENSFTSSFNSGTNNRSDRVWKVDETGTVGEVYFAIPKTAITFPSGIPVLVISNDLTFDSSDDVVNLTDDGTYYWASINPDDEAYLAFATTTPGFTLSKSALTIGENAGTGIFTVVLDAQPLNDVVFKVTSDDTNEATVDESTLTFTTANWDTLQTVTVTGVNDNIDRNDNATITVSVDDASSDDYFDALDDQTVAVTLTNDDEVPTVLTTAASSVISTSGVLGGNVSEIGTSAVTETGVVYSTINTSPEKGGANVTVVVIESETGTFSETIASLLPDTTYYYQAYAISNAGISYGGVESFKTKQVQTITFNELADKTYGDSDVDPAATASSGLTISYSSSDASVATIIDGKIHIVGAGACTIYADQEGNDVYDAAPQASQALTVGKATLTVTADDSSKVYGAANPKLTFTYDGFVNEDSESDLVTAPVASTTATTASAAGDYSITVSGGVDENYTFSYTAGTLTINKATLTVTADDNSKVYGAANPELTFTYDGFVNEDRESDLATAPVASTTATTASAAGDYSITVSGGVDENYTFSYTAGTLTIGKATLTVTADDSSKVYGAANPKLTFTYDGFVNEDSESDLATAPVASTTATTASAAGDYSITVSGGVDENYTFSYTAGTLTINKATLKVTADDKSKVYDGSVFSPFTVSYSGFVAEETKSVLGGSLSFSGNAVYETHAGTDYEIIPGGLTSSNYDISFVSGKLNITKAPLTVTAEDKSKVYDGTVFDQFTLSYSGFVAEETKSVLGGHISFSGNATTATDVGIGYEITPGGLTSLNYNISFVSGKLNITKAPLKVTADDKSKVYDGSVFSPFTVSYSGFVAEETKSVLGGSLSFSGNAVYETHAGTDYEIIPGGLTSSNYDISFVNGKLDITKAPLTVTAEDKSKVYDGTVFDQFTLSYSGFVAEETKSVLGGHFSFSGNATTATDVGIGYEITPGGLTSLNYNISFVSGKLDITKAPLTITADNKSKVYDGSVFSPFTVSYSGFITGEGETDLGGTLTYSGTATTATNVGKNYVITPGGLASSNYDISFINGSLDITQKALTITADNQSKEYDGSVFSPFTVSYSGFITGEGETDLGGTLTYSGTATIATNVGTDYVITPGGLTSLNYNISFVSGKLNITKAPLKVTADNKSKEYDGGVFSLFTVSYSGFVAEENDTDLDGSLSFSGNAIPATDAGEYEIIPQGLTSSNYDISFVNGTLDITPKAITVTADANQMIEYGTPDPTFTYSISPALLSGDSFTGYLNRLPGTDVGYYPIYQGSLSAGPNYALTFVSNNFQIRRREMFIEVDPGQQKVYGENDPAFTYFEPPLSFPDDSLTGSLSREEGEGVGSYQITIGSLSAGPNYVLTVRYDPHFVIIPKAITVTADAKSKVYGETDPALTYQITAGALVGSDALTGSLSRATGEDVGTYAIAIGTLSAGSNYDLTFESKDFTITEKAITVTADAKSKVYGETDPALTYQITAGALVGDDALTGNLSRTSGENVGTYAIAIGTLSAGSNYDLTFENKDFTITEKAITVTADAKSKVYGETDPALTYQITAGALVGDDALTGNLSRTSGENVGTYAIAIGTLNAGSNYDLTFESKDFTITEKGITVTADAKSKVYGETDPALTYQITAGALVGSDALTGSLSRATGEDVGTYAIAIGTLSAGSNYDLTFESKDFTITEKAITVTADAKSKVYGETDPALTYQITAGALVGDDALTGNLSRTSGENVGTYAIAIGTLSAGSNYDLTFESKDFTITEKAITVTADAKSKVYGETEPALTYQITAGALVGSDALTGSLSRATGEDVGTYAIAIGTLSAGSNYDLTFESKDFTITEKAITVTADAKSKVYGETDPALTYQITAGALVGDDALTGSLSRATGENVGTYAIAIGTLSAGSNYDLTFENKDFTITEKAITVTADAKSKVYGETEPALTYQITAGALVGDDALTGSLSRATGENVGTYAIAIGTLSAGSNYDLIFESKDFTITEKAITVTADAKSKVYGETDPALTYQITAGALVGDDALTGNLSRTSGENVGTYAIAIGTLSAGSNYDLTFESKDFTITEKAITVTADAKSKVYGETEPALTYQITAGALVGDDALTGNLSRTSGENVGTYAIAIGTLSAGSNYDLIFESKDFTITEKAITVTADAKSKVYGETDPALTYQITAGALVGDDALTGSLSRATGENVGTYAIVIGTLSAGSNYDLIFESKDFTITEKAITVTADAKSKVYGETDPALTYQITAGALVGDDALTGNLSRTSGENVGTYAIAIGTLSAGSNYDLTFESKDFTITEKAITVTADAKSKVYGETEPALTYQITAGALVGDDALTGNLSRTSGENVGTYAIAIGTLSAGSNYDLIFESKDFTITEKAITVTADAKSKVYGETDPALTYQITAGALVGDDALTGSLSRATGENVGTYAIVIGTLSAGSNYDLTFENKDFTITEKAITVTADAKSKVYGETDPALTYQITAGALVGSDALTGSLSRATGEDVGTYAIAIGTLSAGSNYDLTFESKDFTITEKAITVTADAKSKVYGETEPALTYQITAGALVGDDALTGSLSRATGEDVGDYAISSTLANANYTITFESAALSITEKVITVTADAKSKVYGETDPALTYQITAGALVGDDALTGSLSRATGENVGTYAIAIGTLSAGSNYDLTFENKDFTITEKAITVTADAKSKVYGETEPALTYQITAGALVGDDALTGSLSRATGENVGTYAIAIGTLSAGSNYDLIFESKDFTITEKAITVTADAKSKVYGETDPALTYQITAGALVGDDALTGNLSRTSGENVGTYAIAIGTLSAGSNYDLTFESKDFTITEKAITVTADAKSKVYGETEPALTYQITAGALVGDDALTGNLSRTSGENVGTYAIAIGTLSAGSNYDLIFESKDFTITEKAITVTADAKSKVYGETDPALTYQITAGALVGDDALTGSLSRATGENVGTYAIVIGTLSAGSNYDLTFENKDFTITEKAITVTADAKSKVYGETDPALTYQITAGALVGSDALTGNLSRTSGENVGTYAIAIGTLSAGSNYDLIFESKDFTITEKAITVTADAKSKVYGETDPALTYQITAGALVGDDALTGSLSRATGEDVGTYAIAIGTLSAGSNYDLTFESKDFTITEKAITVTADAKSKVYGETDPALTYQITAGALVGSDALTGSLSRATGEDVGTYAIAIGTLSAGSNYDLIFESKDFTITEKAITVTADAKSKVYGETDPALTYQITAGALVGDDALTGSLSRATGENVGTYAIAIGTLSAGSNYDLTFESKDFTINKKTITVIAADKSKTYGEDNPELTFTYSGFVNGDNESDLIKAPVASTEATAVSVAGNYKITVTGGVDENYDFTYNDATLTIEKATLIVTATAKDKGYDGTTTASITLSDDRVSGDMLTINATSAEFEDKNVGAGKPVTVSGIILSGTDANNYQLASKTASATADITKKDLTVNNAVAHNKVYDGTTDAVTSGAVLKGVVPNDNVELENESVGIFAQSTVGNDIDVTTLMTINGADAANYSLVQPTGLKADITEKELIITGTFTVSDKEYEGAMDATIATNNLDLSGILGEDEVTLTNVVAAFETASAGNGLTVNIVSADLTGDDADQYSLSLENSPTATASIWKKTATVTGASGITKTYDGNKLLPSEMVAYGELNGILSEDETQVELTGNPLFDLADAGDRVIVQGNLKLTGPKADNYSLVWTDGTGKIEKATLIVEVNNDAKFVTQDDENNYAGVSISGYVNGENNSAIDQTGLTIIRNNATENIAGEYTDVLEASGLLADNYVFTYLSGDYSIIPAHELLVEINDTSIVYSEVSTYGISSARYLDSDGNTIKELTENITALNNNQFSIDDGVGSTVNFSINEINPEYNSLSNRLVVGSYQLEATAVSGSSTNFNNTIHVTGALTVTTKEVEVQIVSGSERKAFDGDANMDNLDMFTSDLVAGDDVELSGNGSFSQSEAGTDIAYSVTFALQGADKDNYHLKTDVPIIGNDGKIAHIELIVIEAKASNKVYDGTTTATIIGATLNGAITGDDVTLANENTGAFVTDAVGNDIEVLTSMTLAGADKDNYVLIQPTGLKANIEPQELAVTNVAAKNKVYDGTTNATIVDATLSGVVADDEVLLENAESGTFKQDIVGTEIEVTTAMTMSGADASNYKLIQPIGITADITTRELTVKDAVAENKVYDGTVNAVVSGAVLDGYVSGDDVILANHAVGTFIQSSVGENIQVVTLMTLEGDDKDNYTLKQPSYLTANITAAELTLSGSFVVNNKEYDGTAIATMLENNLQFNGLASGDIVSLDSIILAFETSNAGTGLEVYITGGKITGSDASKYSFSLNGAPVTIANINKKELAVTNAAAKNKVYDGTTDATIVDATLSGVVADDEVLLENAESGTFKQDIVGTEIEVTTAMTMSGADASNYKLIQPIGITADITTRELTVKDAVAENKVYDGTVNAVVSGAVLDGYVSGDDVILANHAVGTFIQSSVGENIQVVTLMTLEGDDKDNYTLKQPSYLTANITAAELTLSGSFVVNNKEYDGTAIATMLENNLQFNGLASGDIVSLDSIILAFETSDAGTGLEVYITGGKITGSDASKYSFSLNGAPVTIASINKKELAVTNVAAKNKVYDGTTNATIVDATLSGVVADDEVLLENAESGTFKQDIVGTEIEVTTAMTMSGADASNYKLIQPIGITADITTRELTVKDAVAENKVYDGTVNAVVSGAVLDGYVSGDDVILANHAVGTFIQSSVGENIQVVTLMTLEGDDKDNYTLKQPSYLTANITAAELTLSGSFVVNNKEYDGTAIATMLENNLQFNGLASGDIVSLDSIILAFETSNAGTGLEVYITGGKITGSDASKYSFSLNGAPVTIANINKKELAVTNAAAKNKVYDGTTDATIVDATLSGVVADDEVLLENAESGTFKQDIVGTEIEVTTAMTMSGADASNYKLIQPIGITADITTRELTVKDAVAENKVYDGTVNAVVSGAVLDGYVSGDDVILANHAVGTFIQSSVGENIQVVTLMTLEGDDKDNYTLKQPSYLTANITAAELTLSGSFVVNNKEYDGTAIATMLENNLQFNGLASGDIVSLDSIILAFETSDAGTGLEVYITGGKITGSDASKYSFSLNGAPVTIASINKKELIVTADDKTKEYDGLGYSSFTVSYNGFIDGEDETNLSGALSFTGTATTAINAETDYTITPGGLSSENYAIIYVDGYLDIHKVDQTITFDPIPQQILGNSSFELSAVASSGLTIEYFSSDESVATISGKIVTFINSGTCTIYANQPGNVNYNAAEQVLQILTIIPYISGDSNHDGIITPPEIAGDSNEDGQINDGEVAGDTNGNGQIDDDEVAGDNNGDGKISEPEVAGDTDGNGQIDDDEVAGDNNGDGKISEPEVAGDTDGNGQIDDDEVAGDNNGDGKITEPEVTGDTNGNGQIDDDEVAGDNNGDGKISEPEVAGDTDGNGQIDDDEVAGDNNGDGKITEPEVTGDTNGNGQIDDDEVAGDNNGDGKISEPEVAGDTDGNGQIDDDEVAGDTDGDGTITDPEVSGDTNGDGQVTSPEIIGDTDGNGIINDDEVTGDRNGDGNIGSGETAGESGTEGSNIAGDTNGDGKITDTEVAGDTNGDGQIGNGEIAGDTDGDGQITDPEVAGDTDGNGQIDDDEVAGDNNGDGKITDSEVAGDTNGDGQIGNGEIAGDTDGDGQITDPEVAGDTDGNGQIDDDEVAGDNNGDGKITDTEVAGDTNGDGQIGNGEIAGDTDGDGQITDPEVAGDTDGNGQIDDDEVAGDNNGDGKITNSEVAGDTDGNGQINDDEVAGDNNGDGKITDTEVAGDTNGDGQIGNGEIAGDTDGDGQITDPEVAGDTDGNGQIDDDEVAGDNNGDGKITDPEVAGDTDGNGQINDDERIGDVNGDGQITAPEIAGDADGNGVINNNETPEGTIANISILSIEENTYENPDSEIYYLIDCEDESNQVAVTFTPDAYATSPHVREFNIEIPGPGLYNEEINVVSEDGINTRTYRIVVEKRFNYNDIVIQKYNNVLLINNNPATNGGYRFTAFNWYKDGVLIGTGQYYSVGDNASDQLDLNAMYSVEIETEDGDVFSTCDFTVSYSNIFSLKVAPNPVRSGSTIDVTTTYTTDMLSDLTISVRNLYGVEVMQEMSGSNNSRITLPSSLTPGTYVVSTKAGGVELSAKIIVQ